MSRGPDAGTQLSRALEASAAAAGCVMRVVEADWSRWASATFSGARHCVEMEGAEDWRLERWLEGIAEAELPLRGHLVADAKLVRVRRAGGIARAVIEALTVEDR